MPISRRWIVLGADNTGDEEEPPGSSASRSAKLDGWMCSIALRSITEELVTPFDSEAVTTTSWMETEAIRRRTVWYWSRASTAATDMCRGSYPTNVMPASYMSAGSVKTHLPSRPVVAAYIFPSAWAFSAMVA